MLMRMPLMRMPALVAAGLVAGTLAAEAQRGPDVPLTGADTYREYCTGCHGRSGRGDGAIAGTLAARPADLSTLAQQNGGRFPRQRVKGAILNVERPVAAHSTGVMPVWAHVFSALDSDAARVDRRLDELVGFVETLQQPVLPTTENGRALFAAHCAACHGPTGEGGEAPELTTFAMRNGGVFPSERLARIIDGRGVPAHARREMPIWGDAFRTVPGESTREAASARVTAVTRFLESIQQHASR